MDKSTFSDQAACALCWYDWQDFDQYMQQLQYNPLTDKIQARKRYKQGKILFIMFQELGFTENDLRGLVMLSNDLS